MQGVGGVCVGGGVRGVQRGMTEHSVDSCLVI